MSAWGVSAPGGYLLPGAGGCCSGRREVSAPGGCLLLGGCLLGGVSAPRGDLLKGVSARGDGIPACTEADTPPVDRITDACKNIFK